MAKVIYNNERDRERNVTSVKMRERYTYYINTLEICVSFFCVFHKNIFNLKNL